MNLVPVPSRVFKTISLWVLIITGVIDLSHVLLATLTDLHVLTATQLAAINAVLAFVAGVAKFVQQNIKLTEEQKDTLIAAVANAPTKPEPPQ